MTIKKLQKVCFRIIKSKEIKAISIKDLKLNLQYYSNSHIINC